MQHELLSKLELTRMLFRYTQTIRCSKRQPELAAVAAEKEMQFKREVEQLERELAATEQPALIKDEAA